MGSSGLNRREFIRQICLAAGAATVPSPIRKGLGSLVREVEAATTSLGLKDYAPEGLNIGCAMARLYEEQPDLNQYRALVKREFNQIVPESVMNWHDLQPIRAGSYQWFYCDELMQWAAENNIQVIGNTPVNPMLNPDWLSTLTKEEVIDEALRHTETLVGRYAGMQTKDGRKLIVGWNVVNEAIDPAYHETWEFHKNLPYSIIDSKDEMYEFLKAAFVAAKSADPVARLYYSDCLIEEWGFWKTNAAFEMLTMLLTYGAPVEGLSSQTHIFDLTQPPVYELVGENFRRFYSELGIPVRVSEMDVIFKQCEGTLQNQANIFRGVMEQVLLNRDAVVDFTFWNPSDKYNWVPPCDNLPDWYVPGNPCSCPGMPGPDIFDEKYQNKPAYYAIESALEEYQGS